MTTSEGTPHARFRRALEARSVMQAETAAREMSGLRLRDAVDFWFAVLDGAERPPDSLDSRVVRQCGEQPEWQAVELLRALEDDAGPEAVWRTLS
jgi:hypothetical protein